MQKNVLLYFNTQQLTTNLWDTHTWWREDKIVVEVVIIDGALYAGTKNSTYWAHYTSLHQTLSPSYPHLFYLLKPYINITLHINYQ